MEQLKAAVQMLSGIFSGSDSEPNMHCRGNLGIAVYCWCSPGGIVVLSQMGKGFTRETFIGLYPS